MQQQINAQLIMLKVYKNKRTSRNQVTVAVRHNKKWEMTLPLYIGQTVYVTTWKLAFK